MKDKYTKEQLINFFKEVKEDGLDMVIKLKMPNQKAPEIIMNYNSSIVLNWNIIRILMMTI